MRAENYQVEWQRERRRRWQCGSCGITVTEINQRTKLPYTLCSDHRRVLIPGTQNKTVLRRRENGLCVQCGRESGLNPKTAKPKFRCLSCNQQQRMWEKLREARNAEQGRI